MNLVHLSAILSNVVLEHLFGNIRGICHQHPVVLALWFYEQRSVLKFEANDENSASWRITLFISVNGLVSLSENLSKSSLNAFWIVYKVRRFVNGICTDGKETILDTVIVALT